MALMEDICIPKLGVAMTEATLVAWHVADGDEVTAGQALYTVETDKTEMEIESPGAGRIAIEGAVGETYPVGTVVARLG